MTRIEEHELVYWLAHQDEQACLLVVEGNTDLRFWSLFVPISQRSRTVVYPIDRIEVPGAPNSSRERAMVLANRLWETGLRERVRFFLDADADHLLGRPCPHNVILTDFRDLEAYAYHVGAMRLMLFSFGIDPDFALDVMTSLTNILRPCGLLRLLDAIEELCLPFQTTWGDRLRRQINGARNNPQLEPRDLMRRLLQNARISLDQLDWAEARFRQLVSDWAHTATTDLMHGKDLVSAISWRFDVDYEEAERAVLAALAESRSDIMSFPQLRVARDFVLLK